MTRKAPNLGAAVRHLKKVDPVLARVIEKVGPCKYVFYRDTPPFHAIISSIIYQQISGKAAQTILNRFKAIYGGEFPTPEALLETPDEQLRSAGLSRQKIGYLRDLATKAASGEVPFDHLDELEDDAIIDALVKVKGVGRWTAQMFLMFRLGRPDVLAEADLGIQNAIRRAYRMRARPVPIKVKKLGARWAPYRTIACWYLWRSLDGTAGRA